MVASVDISRTGKPQEAIVEDLYRTSPTDFDPVCMKCVIRIYTRAGSSHQVACLQKDIICTNGQGISHIGRYSKADADRRSGRVSCRSRYKFHSCFDDKRVRHCNVRSQLYIIHAFRVRRGIDNQLPFRQRRIFWRRIVHKSPRGTDLSGE